MYISYILPLIHASDILTVHNISNKCKDMKKTYIKTDEPFEEALQKLKSSNPGFSGSQLIRVAVIQAAVNDLRISFATVQSNTAEAIVSKKKAVPKEELCEMYGGSVADGVCTIDKYETVATGHVRKVKRVIALTAMLNDIDSFKKDILGHFDSLEVAEEAYQNKPLA